MTTQMQLEVISAGNMRGSKKGSKKVNKTYDNFLHKTCNYEVSGSFTL